MDFIAGAISGLSQTLVGHPFDTIKVMQQNNIQIRSIKNTLTPNRLYKGLLYPSVSNTIVNSILFASYNKTNSLVNNNHFVSGMISGFIISPIVFTFDVGKTKKQMKQSLSLRDFYKTKGLKTTFMRETIAFGVYFQSYNYLKAEHKLHPLVSGALAGLANWTSTYTLDVIRNRQIVNNCSFIEAYTMGELWKGYPVCAVRALLVNAVGFYVYELIMSVNTED